MLYEKKWLKWWKWWSSLAAHNFPSRPHTVAIRSHRLSLSFLIRSSSFRRLRVLAATTQMWARWIYCFCYRAAFAQFFAPATLTIAKYILRKICNFFNGTHTSTTPRYRNASTCACAVNWHKWNGWYSAVAFGAICDLGDMRHHRPHRSMHNIYA